MHLHSLDIIHRDIKSDNVMINKNGYLVLIDFGISFKLKPGLEASTVAGTMQYMSPEMLCNQKYGKSIDWWAMGVLLYQMMFGCLPYRMSKLNLNTSNLDTF